MSDEVIIIIAGYVLIVMIIIGILSFYVLTDIAIELYKTWDEYKRKKEQERYERKRRKTL